jgi:hypothetical protein
LQPATRWRVNSVITFWLVQPIATRCFVSTVTGSKAGRENFPVLSLFLLTSVQDSTRWQASVSTLASPHSSGSVDSPYMYVRNSHDTAHWTR